MKEQFKTLAQMVQSADRVVFFGGAGVSTESGIPDFRSEDGVYASKWPEPPERILSHTYFMHHPDRFFEFYRAKMLFPNARPNKAHKTLALLEEQGKLSHVITQNIDGLHQAAGSKQVLELHGSVHRNYCMQCGAAYPLQALLDSTGIPHCDRCNGIIKPDVVLYEEPLNETVIQDAVGAIQTADLLIVGGTSLQVYPAAYYVRLCPGKIAIINKTPTPMDRWMDLAIYESIGETLDSVVHYLFNEK